MREKNMGNNIFSLEEKKIVVFGGAGYLGCAAVKAMVDLGAKVVVADMFPDFENARDRFHELSKLSGVTLLPCNVDSSEQIRAAYDKCIELYGGFNAMVNLVYYGAPANMEVMTDEQFECGVSGCVTHQFRAIREAIPYFEKNGGGAIVTTGSMYGVVSPDPRIYGVSGQNNPVNYGPTKAAVIQLTRYAAGHLADRNIRVNCVVPGPFPEDKYLPPEEFLRELSHKTMLGRVGKSSEIAGAFCYLVSDASSFCTGSTVTVDGGWTAW